MYVNRPRPPDAKEYLQFASRGGVAVLVGLLSLFAYIEYHLWYLLPLALACGFYAYMVIRQARSFDRQAEYAMQPVITIDKPAPKVITRTRYTTVKKTSATSSNINTHGDIDLPDHEWPKLAAYVLKHNGVSRDGLLRLKLSWKHSLQKTSPNGITYYEELVKAWGRGETAWLNGTELTQAGREHFQQFIQPVTYSPTPPLNYQPAKMHGIHETTN